MKQGIILIHGLTGTPATMAHLAGALSRSGFIVTTPLLTGHDGSIEELAKTRWEDWYNDVCRSYDELKKRCGEICPVGLSLGSLLALKLAEDESRPVKKIVCMGTPLRLSPLLTRLAIPLSHLPIIRNLLKTSAKNWEASVGDPAGREIYKSSSYPKIPVRSVWELQKLQSDVMQRLDRISAETLIIHSKNDRVAPPSNVGLLADSLRNRAEVLWLGRSEHVITLDYEKDAVADAVIGFLRRPLGESLRPLS